MPTKERTLGLPLKCPACPPRRYFGILKNEDRPSSEVRLTPRDVCENCKTPLVPTRSLPT